MSDAFMVHRVVDPNAKKPNVAGVGAWLSTAKTLRREFADYVPRHRAPGMAV